MEDEKDDPIMTYAILGFIFFMIAVLLFRHTGADKSIEPLYWAGVVTPLLPQIARKVFNLTKKVNGKS